MNPIVGLLIIALVMGLLYFFAEWYISYRNKETKSEQTTYFSMDEAKKITDTIDRIHNLDTSEEPIKPIGYLHVPHIQQVNLKKSKALSEDWKEDIKDLKKTLCR